MLKLRTRGGSPTGGLLRRRSVRSVAALVTTSLVAPAAIASLTTTAVTTMQAAPAAAAAPRAFVVAGDGTVTGDCDGPGGAGVVTQQRTGLGGGAWGFHSDDYAELRSIITNATDFGPNGTVKATFTIGAPVDGEITDAKLANVDVYFSGAVAGSDNAACFYTPAERAALLRFVRRGGVLVINQNSPDWNTGQIVSEAGGGTVAQQGPPAIFEAETIHAGLAGGFEAPYKPTIGSSPTEGAGRAVPGAPLINGPFGTVTSFSLWHTVAGFTALPAEAVVNARVQSRCDVAQLTCADPTTPPQPTTTSTTTTAGPTTTTTPAQAFQPYDNDLDNLAAVATIAPGTGIAGLGGVVLTSDVDVYSSHDEYNGGVMKAGNRLLARNTFAWIAGILNANNPVEGYTSVTPTRWVDTRSGAKLGAGARLDIPVAGVTIGSVTIPADATGVVMNVTATQPSGASESYLTVYPTAGAPNTPPNSSNLNFREGVDVPNMVMVKIGTGGRVSIYNNAGAVHVLADVVGYFRPATGDRLNSTNPSRILDTRSAIGSSRSPIGEGESRTLQVTGGVVPNGASAVALNVTASAGTRGGYLTVYPGNLGSAPNTSNLNFSANQDIPNLVIVPLAPDGTVKVFNAFGATEVIADVLGYFSGSGGTFAQLDPTRLLDTRTGNGVPAGRLGAASTLEFQVTGRNGIPASGVRTVILNITAAAPAGPSYLTVFPGPGQPEASNLNFAAGQTIPNLVVAQVNSQGRVRIYNFNANTDVIADAVAWFN
jgi:hypothetical protein